MAKLSEAVAERVWTLKRQLANIINDARTAEFAIYHEFGENPRTEVYLDELQSIAEQATDKFSQLSTLQIRIFNIQPSIPGDMLDLTLNVVTTSEARVPALQQSISEITMEWNLP
jgi:hypothetical protein